MAGMNFNQIWQQILGPDGQFQFSDLGNVDWSQIIDAVVNSLFASPAAAATLPDSTVTSDQTPVQVIPPDNSRSISGALTDANNDGKFTFADFAKQYGFHELTFQPDPQNPDMAPGGRLHDETYARTIAQSVDGLPDDSVAINRTLNVAIVQAAEQIPGSEDQGRVHYVVFDQGSGKFMMFSGNVTVNADGTFKLEMGDQAQSWDMSQLPEQSAFGNLRDRFATAAAPQTSLVADFNAAVTDDLAVGQVVDPNNPSAELRIEHRDDGLMAASSAADINKDVAVGIEKVFDGNGNATIELNIMMRLQQFRENAEAIGQVQTQVQAPGIDPAGEKFNFIESQRSGINVFKF